MKKALLVAFLSVVAFASEAAASGGTDIVARTINFLIFAAILWYLVGNKAITFFRNRKEEIANKFQEVENKLKEAKLKKEELKAKLEEAKIKAAEIVEDSKKEAEHIYNSILEETKAELEMLEKHFEEAKLAEIRKAKREAIKAFLEDVLKDIHLTSEDAAKLVLKVA
ncbi:F0F1 ATP synthase subunit B family protein [Nautilia lithotrophica]